MRNVLPFVGLTSFFCVCADWCFTSGAIMEEDFANEVIGVELKSLQRAV